MTVITATQPIGDTITAVIPYWHGEATIQRLLASIPTNIPVIIVNDYGSAPPLVKRGKTSVLSLGARGYFAGACNAGMDACATDVLILNQDVWLEGEAWLNEIRRAQRDGVATYGDGVMGHPAWTSGYVQGTFMYISRAAISAVGGFNTDLYPLWGATAEWQVRACRAGFAARPQKPVPGLKHGRDKADFGDAITRALKEQPQERGRFIRTPPEVSVIVACYNYGQYLPAAIESLLKQTFQSFEIIIIDDASPDGSGEICESYADGWKGIKVIRNASNLGTAATFNKAIEAARGRFFTHVSADDELAPWALEKLYSNVLQHPHGFVYGDMQAFNAEREWEFKVREYDFDELLKRNHVPVGIMVAKAAWEEVGGYPEQMDNGREDWAFAIALGLHGWCGNHIGNTGYRYRREKQNRSVRTAKERDYNYYLEKIQAIFPDVYNGRYPMGCCGQRAPKVRRTVDNTQVLSVPVSQPAPGADYVLLTYTGKQTSRQTYHTKVGRSYKFGRNRKYLSIWVHKDDVDEIMATKQFKYAQLPKPPAIPVTELSKPAAIPVTELPAAKPEPTTEPTTEPTPEPEKPEVKATAGAIALAAGLGIDLTGIHGHGVGGKVTKNDVQMVWEQYHDNAA